MKARSGNDELLEIRDALTEIRADLRRLASQGDVSHGGANDRALDALLNQLLEDVDVGLERAMVRRCGMRETCKAVFTDLLQKSAGLVGEKNVSEETINAYRGELEKRRSEAPKPQCSQCFEEVSDLFEKHVRVARSLKIYREDEEIRVAIALIPEELIIKSILEPIANRQRLQIMKMLSSQAHSFTAISEHSGLRGGNLLFHLQRLTEAGMVVQQHERGDYLLTEKGYRVLTALSELSSTLGGVERPRSQRDSSSNNERSTGNGR